MTMRRGSDPTPVLSDSDEEELGAFQSWWAATMGEAVASCEELDKEPVKQILQPSRGGMGGYRKSIYGFNLVLLVLLVAFAVVAYFVLREPWLWLFDVRLSDPSLLYVYAGTGLQLAVVCLGLSAVFLSSRVLLQLYWSATLCLLALDAAVGFWWVHRFYRFHIDFPPRLKGLWEAADEAFCRQWRVIERELNCCGHRGPGDYAALGGAALILSSDCSGPANGSYPASCFDEETELLREFGCTNQLLLWLQSEADKLFIVGYGLLFLLKAVYVFILRKEMSELLGEIFHGRHKHLVHSWVEPDTPPLSQTLYEALPDGREAASGAGSGSGSGPAQPLEQRYTVSCDELGASAASASSFNVFLGRRLSSLFTRRPSLLASPEPGLGDTTPTSSPDDLTSSTQPLQGTPPQEDQKHKHKFQVTRINS